MSVHDSDGTGVRVVHYAHHQLAFGWIEASRATRLRQKPSTDFGHGWDGLGTGSGWEGGHWVERQCPTEIALILRAEQGETVTIGHLDAGAPFLAALVVGRPTGTCRTIELQGVAWMERIAGASLAVREVDLARCSRP